MYYARRLRLLATSRVEDLCKTSLFRISLIKHYYVRSHDEEVYDMFHVKHLEL